MDCHGELSKIILNIAMLFISAIQDEGDVRDTLFLQGSR